MAGPEESTYVIGGHVWRDASARDVYATASAYSLADVRRCGGDPERVRRECPNFDGNTYTMETSR